MTEEGPGVGSLRQQLCRIQDFLTPQACLHLVVALDDDEDALCEDLELQILSHVPRTAANPVLLCERIALLAWIAETADGNLEHLVLLRQLLAKYHNMQELVLDNIFTVASLAISDLSPDQILRHALVLLLLESDKPYPQNAQEVLQQMLVSVCPGLVRQHRHSLLVVTTLLLDLLCFCYPDENDDQLANRALSDTRRVLRTLLGPPLMVFIRQRWLSTSTVLQCSQTAMATRLLRDMCNQTTVDQMTPILMRRAIPIHTDQLVYILERLGLRVGEAERETLYRTVLLAALSRPKAARHRENEFYPLIETCLSNCSLLWLATMIYTFRDTDDARLQYILAEKSKLIPSSAQSPTPMVNDKQRFALGRIQERYFPKRTDVPTDHQPPLKRRKIHKQ